MTFSIKYGIEKLNRNFQKLNLIMDVREHPKTIEAINRILDNKGIAEVKQEKDDTLVVVEVRRTVKNSEKENG